MVNMNAPFLGVCTHQDLCSHVSSSEVLNKFRLKLVLGGKWDGVV
jgi:hypothetical protein